jgi:hypothetical protein
MKSPCHNCPLVGTDKSDNGQCIDCKAREAYLSWLSGDRIEVAGTWFEDRREEIQRSEAKARAIAAKVRQEAAVKYERCTKCDKKPDQPEIYIQQHSGGGMAGMCGECRAKEGIRRAHLRMAKHEEKKVKANEIKAEARREEAKVVVVDLAHSERMKRYYAEHPKLKHGKKKKTPPDKRYYLGLDLLSITGSEDEANQIIARIMEQAKKERRPMHAQAVVMLERACNGGS